MSQMPYRKLGGTGLRVSALSFGSWVTFGKQLDIKSSMETMAAAKDYGVNFYDNAEVYAKGQSEELMGEVIHRLKWDRLSYVISTKFFWGITGDINGTNTLNRKYLRQAIEGSLKRLKLEYVDLVYCHRPDPETPMEEVVWAMHDMIHRGQALYWGTSEWSADQIRAAYDFADKNSLHKPVVEQPQYHLMHRDRVEKEYSHLYKSIGLGLTTWSPLASGVLTGKYLNGIPANSRGSNDSLKFIFEDINHPEKKEKIQKFVNLAKDLQVEPAQLAIAWCASNPNVSTVITGASRVEQLHQNMKALDWIPKIQGDLKARIEKCF